MLLITKGGLSEHGVTPATRKITFTGQRAAGGRALDLWFVISVRTLEQLKEPQCQFNRDGWS